MIRLNELKGKLVAAQKTYDDCAKELKISRASFSDKMNGKSKFYVEEAFILANYISLTEADRVSIFFGEE